MAQAGLRILSLDGGGTRVLSLLYILREIMGRLVPDEPDSVRPCEFFDLIGGSGPSGILALAFSRFNFTIREAIELMQSLSVQFDNVEEFLDQILDGEEEDKSWEECVTEYSDRLEQIQALRQGIVQDKWSETIKEKVSDVLERHPYTFNGEFDFKHPSAEVEAGRPKAFVVGSESKGYGPDGGTNVARRYHVPLLHRTYHCRHGKTLYTLYAVGLGTVASPEIMKPGVIFPDLLATGEHTLHNPIRLLLEESTKLWPGLRIGTLLSIGTGAFQVPLDLGPVVSSTAEACSAIWADNQQITNDFRKFVLPFDKVLAPACFRFELEQKTPFLEHSARDEILDGVEALFELPKEATKCARVVSALDADDFPSSPEDQIALAALGGLLHTLISSAYMNEAELLGDVICNFILYEGAAVDEGSFRKVEIAAHMCAITDLATDMRNAYDQVQRKPNTESPSAALTGELALGDYLNADDKDIGPLESVTDVAAAAYFFLVKSRREGSGQVRSRGLLSAQFQLSKIMKGPLDPNSVSGLLRLAMIAALCEAGNIELLKGCKRILFNGPFVRHLYKTLTESTLEGISDLILGPIANSIALLLHGDNWSTFRDVAVLNILRPFGNQPQTPWVMVNLALEYMKFSQQESSSITTAILELCGKLVSQSAMRFESNRSDVAIESVRKGYYRLLKKCLKEEGLPETHFFDDGAPCSSTPKMMQDVTDKRNNNLLHLAARTGFPWITKSVVECLGIPKGKEWVNMPNGLGQTPLHLACKYRAPKEVFVLLNILAASRDQQCLSGRTPLHYCFPHQNHLPGLYDLLLRMVEERVLPTTISLQPTKLYGVYGKGKNIDPRVSSFRVIINWLVTRGADFSIQDEEGLTPLHLAAKEGWADNLDTLLTCEGGSTESRQMICLTVKDKGGATLLDHARMIDSVGALRGGQNIVVTEMRKRGLPLSNEPVDAVRKRYTEQLALHSKQVIRDQRISMGGSAGVGSKEQTQTQRSAAETDHGVVSDHPSKPDNNYTVIGTWNVKPSPPTTQQPRPNPSQPPPGNQNLMQQTALPGSQRSQSPFVPSSRRDTSSSASQIDRPPSNSIPNSPSPAGFQHGGNGPSPLPPGHQAQSSPPTQTQRSPITNASGQTQQVSRPTNTLMQPSTSSSASPDGQQRTSSTSKLMKRFMKKG